VLGVAGRLILFLFFFLLPPSTHLKVFSDTEFLKKALTWDRFSVVEEVKVRQQASAATATQGSEARLTDQPINTGAGR